jgi:predicted lipid-binding transport protein (Tim44 family)
MQTAAQDGPQGACAMWIGIGILLLLLWAGGFFAFHAAGFLIHILLICAVVSFVIHFITGRRAAV